jgi:hypothetical protein
MTTVTVDRVDGIAAETVVGSTVRECATRIKRDEEYPPFDSLYVSCEPGQDQPATLGTDILLDQPAHEVLAWETQRLHVRDVARTSDGRPIDLLVPISDLQEVRDSRGVGEWKLHLATGVLLTVVGGALLGIGSQVDSAVGKPLLLGAGFLVGEPGVVMDVVALAELLTPTWDRVVYSRAAATGP